MLNKAILIGRLTRNPELRHTQSNMAVVSFTLAVDRDRKDQNGNRQADFISCVAWGKKAEFVSQWFTKGMMAVVVGRIQSRNWKDQNGNNRTAIEVICDEVTFGETKKSETQDFEPSYQKQEIEYVYQTQNGGDFQELQDSDGDVPF